MASRPRTNHARDNWIDNDPTGYLPYLLAQSGLSRPDFIRSYPYTIDTYIDTHLARKQAA